jgi:predicted HAD superfamily Cof-like phosphohydrolase
MLEQIKQVKEFHEAFNVVNNNWPTKLEKEEYELRHKLMAEENDEYLQACEENNILGIADALTDKFYILCGTILRHGMQHIIEDLFEEVHRSNMSKLGEDGKPIYREDGKILKGKSYFKPDLSKFIDVKKD